MFSCLYIKIYVKWEPIIQNLFLKTTFFKKQTLENLFSIISLLNVFSQLENNFLIIKIKKLFSGNVTKQPFDSQPYSEFLTFSKIWPILTFPIKRFKAFWCSLKELLVSGSHFYFICDWNHCCNQYLKPWIF